MFLPQRVEVLTRTDSTPTIRTQNTWRDCGHKQKIGWLVWWTLQEDSNPKERYCANKVVTFASFLSHTEDRLAISVISFATTSLKEVHGSSLDRQLRPNYYWYRLYYSLPSLRKYHASSSRCSEFMLTAVLIAYLLFSSAASLLASLFTGCFKQVVPSRIPSYQALRFLPDKRLKAKKFSSSPKFKKAPSLRRNTVLVAPEKCIL